MLKKEDILKVLKKYGFYSLNRAPYLYQNEGQLGVYFVWPNKQYGHLERVSYFEDEASVEEAIFKYWWFINHKDQYPITVEFDDYEIVHPNIIYKYKNCVLTVEEMKTFSEFLETYVDPKEELIRKQLSRTVTILLSLLPWLAFPYLILSWHPARWLLSVHPLFFSPLLSATRSSVHQGISSPSLPLGTITDPFTSISMYLL